MGRILIIIKFVLTNGEDIRQRKLLVWHHIDTAPFRWMVDCFLCDSILPRTSEELFYFYKKKHLNHAGLAFCKHLNNINNERSVGYGTGSQC